MVITTYATLARELNFDMGGGEGGNGAAPAKRQRTLRRPKRYRVVPSPLTQMLWWRVCLDEAQMIDSPVARAAQMARELPAVNRWCVSGTPLLRGNEDLYGLLVFLQADPLHVVAVWRRVKACLGRGDEFAARMLEGVVRRLMWRHAKDDVLEDLHLPPQRSEVINLDFNAVEGAFYRNTYGRCAQGVSSIIKAWNRRNAPPHSTVLTKDELQRVLRPLTALRKVCVHAQIADRGLMAQQRSHKAKGPVTQQQVLDSLLAGAKNDCLSAQRECVACWNGLGGLALLQDQVEHAVECYLSALKYKNLDSLQELHASRNLVHCYRLLQRKASAADAQGAANGAATAVGSHAKALEGAVDGDAPHSEAIARLCGRSDQLEASFMRATGDELVKAVVSLGKLAHGSSGMLPGDRSVFEGDEHTPLGHVITSTKATAKQSRAQLDWLLEWGTAALDYVAENEAVGKMVRSWLRVVRTTCKAAHNRSAASQLMRVANGDVFAEKVYRDTYSLQHLRVTFLEKLKAVIDARETCVRSRRMPPCVRSSSHSVMLDCSAISCALELCQPSDHDIAMSYACNVCRQRGGAPCPHCERRKEIDQYWRVLVISRQGTGINDGIQRRKRKETQDERRFISDSGVVRMCQWLVGHVPAVVIRARVRPVAANTSPNHFYVLTVAMHADGRAACRAAVCAAAERGGCMPQGVDRPSGSPRRTG